MIEILVELVATLGLFFIILFFVVVETNIWIKDTDSVAKCLPLTMRHL